MTMYPLRFRDNFSIIVESFGVPAITILEFWTGVSGFEKKEKFELVRQLQTRTKTTEKWKLRELKYDDLFFIQQSNGE